MSSNRKKVSCGANGCNKTVGCGSIGCGKCGTWFHAKCAGLSAAEVTNYANELQNPNGKRWYCSQCSKNPDTANDQDLDNEADKGELTPDGNENNELEELVEKHFKDFKSSLLLEFNTKFKSLSKSLETQKVEIENIKADVESLKHQITPTQNQSDQIQEAKEEIKSLKEHIEKEKSKKAQELLKRNVILKGIPKSGDEDLEAIVKEMGTLLGIKLEKVKVLRLGDCNIDEVKPIKIFFENDTIKENFIKNQRSKKINTNQLGFANNQEIYVEEDLTKDNQKLFRTCRKLKREKKIEAAWAFRGVIYIKPNEESKPKPIESEADLQSIFN